MVSTSPTPHVRNSKKLVSYRVDNVVFYEKSQSIVKLTALNLFLTALDNVVFHEKSQSIVTLTALNLFLTALNLFLTALNLFLQNMSRKNRNDIP